MIEDNLLCDKDLFGENFFGELPVDLENVGLDDVNGETWSTALEDLELPMFFGGGQIVSLNDSRDSKTSPKRKDGVKFHTTSPDSVLVVETSNSSSENPPIDPELKLSPKGKRSQRKPVSSIKLEQLSSLISLLSLVHTLHESAEQKHSRKRKRKDETTTTSESQISRICSHCGITKTPQWREGPNGPKTLCNACGVRYRSGRLLPEYRPAASPTFVPSMHSNSHKKIVEMRKKAEAMGKCAEMPSSPVSSVGLMSF